MVGALEEGFQKEKREKGKKRRRLCDHSATLAAALTERRASDRFQPPCLSFVISVELAPALLPHLAALARLDDKRWPRCALPSESDGALLWIDCVVRCAINLTRSNKQRIHKGPEPFCSLAVRAWIWILNNERRGPVDAGGLRGQRRASETLMSEEAGEACLVPSPCRRRGFAHFARRSVSGEIQDGDGAGWL